MEKIKDDELNRIFKTNNDIITLNLKFENVKITYDREKKN